MAANSPSKIADTTLSMDRIVRSWGEFDESLRSLRCCTFVERRIWDPAKIHQAQISRKMRHAYTTL